MLHHCLKTCPFFAPRHQHVDGHDERESDQCAANDSDRRMDQLGLFWICHKYELLLLARIKMQN